MLFQLVQAAKNLFLTAAKQEAYSYLGSQYKENTALLSVTSF